MTATATATSLSAQIKALATRQASALELLEGQLACIKKQNPGINALIHSADEDTLRACAKASDARRQSKKPLSVLDGLTLAVKDNIDVANMPTTAGLGLSKRPTQDAAVVHRARASGMMIIGKLNMHEAALGATTDNPHLGRCHHPLRLGHTPGGSSGGSGAWVASGMGTSALGTDTLGSVRIPAAYCGVSGIKPTQGWVPNQGVVPVSHKLDSVGPLATCPEDLMPLLSLLSGRSAALVPAQHASLKEAALGWIEVPDLQPEVKHCLDSARAQLRTAGFNLRPVAWPKLDLGSMRRAGLLLSELELLATHQEALKTHPEAFSESLLKMLNWAKNQPAEAAEAAQALLAKNAAHIGALFSQYHWFLLPTAPQTAFAFTDPAPANQADYTAPFSISGHPALSLPAGLAEGLPVGLQVVGRHHQDFDLILLAQSLFECLNPTQSRTL